MAYAPPVTVVPSAARTASGNSGPLALHDVGGTLALLLDVTAVAGTSPSLAVSVEHSHDGSAFAPAETVDNFTAVTAAGKKVKAFAVKAPTYRLVWAITGTTPSFTFSVRAYVTS